MAVQLNRFLSAQDRIGHGSVLAELECGLKDGHWMWFTFPQLRGLGQSENSRFYGLESFEEAQAYLDHPILGERLRACTLTILHHAPALTARDILGSPDDLKFRSCMTLFSIVAPNERLWGKVIDAFFKGEADPLTLALLRKPQSDRTGISEHDHFPTRKPA